MLVKDRQTIRCCADPSSPPRAALRSYTEIFSGGVARNQSGAAPERKMMMPSFSDLGSIAVHFRRKGEKSVSVERRIKYPALKRRGRARAD